MQETESRKRMDALTGMRGLACLCIVCFHFYCLFVDDMGLRYDAVPWMQETKYFFEYSKNAVELFFMLSGFLTAWHYRKGIREVSFGTYFRKHYGKLLGASLAVNAWALGNAFVRTWIGQVQGVNTPTFLRFVLSVLMVNTGWVTSYAQTQLPVNSTMWFIDVLLLCYLLYYLIARLGRDTRVYLGLCTGMVVLGWICLDHTPKLPFLWSLNGRGYATFFLGALLAEFQRGVSEHVRKRISLVYAVCLALFFVFHTVLGFERVFGGFGTKTYIRYFEFVAAPGMILAALNVPVVGRVLSCRGLLWLGLLSSAIYYVHNNWMEDCLILNFLAGEPVDLRSIPAFLAMLAGTVLLAMLYRRADSACRNRYRACRTKGKSF